MRAKYLYTAVLSFALGIALYSFFDFGWAFVALFIFLAGTLVIIVKSRYLALIIIVLVSFAFGAARMHIANNQEAENGLDTKVGEQVNLSGVIVAEPDKRVNHINLVIELLSNNNEKVLVRANAHDEFAYGDKVKVNGVLEKPESFVDEGDERIFNYQRYLAKSNIYYVVSFASVEVLSHGHGNLVKRLLFVAKGRYLESIERVIPEPASALAGGITVGAKRAMGEKLEEDFRKTGIIHIVVLSGYNIMVISAFLLFLFSFFNLRVGAVLGAVLIILFAIMTGGSATVVRASAMGLLALFAMQTGRTYVAVRALAIVAFIMLLINPKLLIADVSFQLSFVATLGLIYGISIFASKHADINNQFSLVDFNFRSMVIATVSTQIAVLPLILYYMGDLSIVAVLVNLLVLPAVPIAMLFAFLTGVVGIVSALISTPFGWISYILLEYILKVVDIFANLPFAALHISSFPFFWVVLAYLLLVGLVVSRRHKLPVNI